MLRRRNLLKRLMPILLSLAMMLQSVPTTAMAAELPVAVTAEEAEAVAEPVAEAETAVELTEEAEAAEPAVELEEDAAAEDSTESDEIMEDSEGRLESGAEEDGVKSDETGEDSESRPDAGKIAATEPEAEVTAEEKDTQLQKTGAAKIVVNDTAVSEWVGDEDEPGGITRKLGETGLVFFTEYVEENKVGKLQNAVADWFDIVVDGETVDGLKSNFTYSWVKKSEDGADVPLVDAMPVDAGTYELTISLDIAGTNGLCKSVEPEGGVKLSLTIEKAKIELWPDTWTAPGKTAGGLIDKINENYTIHYRDREEYTVSRDIIDIADKKLPMHVFVIDEGGARQEMQLTDRFDSTKDYVLAIDSIALTANAKVNYELYLDSSYAIEIGERQRTEVRFERKDAGEDLVAVYDAAKTEGYKIEDVTKDLFKDAVTGADGKVTKTGAPAVYIWDDKEEKFVLLEEAEPVASWYTRIQLNKGENYTVDEDAGEFQYEDDEYIYIYKPMKADPVDAGEYFIVWSYAGDAGAYEKSRSGAIRFTIDPAPVVIKIDEKTVQEAGFCDGMTAKDVVKALAKIRYEVYPLVENAETKVLEAGGTPIETTPEFFGTSYGIENETDMAQYFVPEFVLQRRPVKMTEKGGAVITVDEGTADWTETDTLSVVVDNEDEEFEFGEIDDELPQGTEKANLESVEFAFRVFFTGNKVVYEKDGTKNTFGGVSVTDVTTNAANRNYLADITKKRLEDSAVAVSVKTAESVKINTEKIVDAFIADNQDVLYPQPAEGADAKAVHKGTLENPATRIYDQNGLFKDRASYKQAAVHKLGENGALGEATGIENTDKKLTYKWSFITLDQYENYLKTWNEVQRQYKDFDEFYFGTFETLGWTNMEDGSLANLESVGVYRLTVKFDDTDREYRSAETEVFFKVEAQEVIVVPTAEQYVSKESRIDTFKNSLAGKLENRKDYIIYKLPHNSMEEYNALTEEAKKEYELPTEEMSALYETKHGTKYETKIVDDWKILRKEKDFAGQDTEVWIEATGTFADDYTYGIAAHWTGALGILAGGASGDNYTTLDVKTKRATGEVKHHESVGAVKFYDQKIYVEADEKKIEALSHEYDGTAVSLEKAAEALAFYTDETLTDSSRLPAAVINMTDEYDPAKINIYWSKDDCTYANKNAVYGGTYVLLLRFEGGALTTAETVQDDAAAPMYAPFESDGWWYPADDENVPLFTVTPRAITITPTLLSADVLKAGDTAESLVTGDLTVDENIVENDKKFFNYMELAKGGFDVIWDGKNADGTDKEGSAYEYDIDKDGGYPAFAVVDENGGNHAVAEYAIQADGRDLKDQTDYLRFGSTYTVKLRNQLVSPLAESYRVTYAPAEVKIGKRGNAEIDEIANRPDLSSDRIEYNFSDGIYTVMPRGAVKFYDVKKKVTVKDRYGKNQELKDTNILGFRIYSPKEFLSDDNFYNWNQDGTKDGLNGAKFLYKNAIWNAGGYFINDTETEWKLDNDGRDIDGYYIDVVFPLAKDDADRSFNITWEDGYTETFKLADVVLEEDLAKAVAPKSMAFNGVAAKMAVGERQQLNLKITKAQLGDVIAVRYRIKDSEETKNEYISLDPETGVVTALKAGKAATMVEAYPVYKDAKGEFVPVLDSKGKLPKAASTKITVTEVTAPTIKKIVSQGEKLKLYYTVPDNGYRREIYVVDVTKGTEYEGRKKWKPVDFNKAIAEMGNGRWKDAGFAIKPEYSYEKNVDLYRKELEGTYDSKLKAHILDLEGLKAEHEYVIYVRNVSAARALDDGSVVALSASGAVKSVKTTKSQVKGLELGFTVKTEGKDNKNTVTHPVDKDGNVRADEYEVELSAKKAQLNVYGFFSDSAGGNDAAETHDRRKYSLVPTLKEEKDALKKYQLPKLEYAIFDDEDFELNPFLPSLQQSKYAAISKKGLISLKGVDLNGEKTVYIYVRDNMQHQEEWNKFTADARIELTITAKAASVAGKNVKAVVGQSIRLADCLTYKDEEKKALPNYRSGRVTIATEMIKAAEASGYKIEDEGDWFYDSLEGDWRKEHDWHITAVAPDKAKFVLTVSDFDAKGNPMTADITLTSKQMDTVKGLKVTYVDDQNITINFTHAVNKNEVDDGTVYQYAFEIKDARGNVVDKRILSNPGRIDNIDIANVKELKSAQSWIQYNGTGVSVTRLKDNAIWVNTGIPGNQFNYYTGTRAKTKIFAYTYTNDKLVRLSSYTIAVTPLYGNQKADKPAMTKTKTTNIPASYNNADLTGRAPDRRDGNLIEITATNNDRQKNDGELKSAVGAKRIGADAYLFTSGNTYTLRLQPTDENGAVHDVPRDRVSDTLTWKSSNTKVASVKANAGTYTATFKLVNQGETTITVTSKVTKKVIARWAVKVCAVKDGSSYGGDYEPTWTDGFYEKILALYDPFYEGRLEILSMNVPLVIDNRNAEEPVETWVSFTAPHFGKYTFSQSIKTFYDSRDGRDVGGTDSDKAIFLETGQKVYFKTDNATLTVTGTELARLNKENTKDAPLEVKQGYVSFTAWEDNVYTFWLNGTKIDLSGENEESYTEAKMKAGDTWYVRAKSDGRMYVTWRDLSTAAALATPVNVILDKDNQVRYVSYTANVAGEYAFKYVLPEKGVKQELSTANGDFPVRVTGPETEKKDGTKEVVESYYLEEGQKVVIEFRAEPEITDAAKILSASVTVTAEDAALKVTQVSVEALALGVKAQEITNDTEQWYTFTAPKDGFYEFEVAVAERAAGDTTPTHKAWLALYKELFGKSSFETAPTILAMKSGEMLAVKLNHNTVDEVNADGTKAEVKSTANVSVKELVVTPLALGKEKAVQVDLSGDSKETLYYSFTAAVDAKYTMAWQPADAKKDNAKVTFLDSVVTDSDGSSGVESVVCNMAAGNVRYIKVEVKDPEGGNAVNGKLCVTADYLSATALTEGTALPYHLEGKAGAKVQVFKFTAPRAGNYAVVTTVDNNMDTGLPYDYPIISFNDDYKVLTPYEDGIEFAKGETKYFTLRFDEESGGSVKETKGMILIRSAAEEFTGEQQEVAVADGVTKGYTFTITESGRYEFKADYDKNKADVLVDDETLSDASGNYYTKNEKVTISVTGKDEEANASVKLYKPAKIIPIALAVGENTIDVKAGEMKYYELSVSDPKTYEFEVSEITSTAGSIITHVINNENDWSGLSDSNEVSISKNSKLTIRITSTSEKKELNCRLNIAERKELKIGDNAVTLKAGETVKLLFRAPETGYYSFRVNQAGAELVFSSGISSKAGDSFYDIRKRNAKSIYTYILKNEGAADVTLIVKMAAVTPIAVTTESRTAELSIPADEVAYYALKTFKKADYLIKIADTSKGADLDVDLYNKSGSGKLTGSTDKKDTSDGITIEKELSDEVLLRVANTGIKETSVTVELALDEAQPLTADAITLVKNESKLISFVAAEDNRYLVSKDNDKVTMTLVRRQDASKEPTDSEEPEETEVKITDAYREIALGKADKLVYRLEYKSDPDDEKAAEKQTVNVKIAPIVPGEITAESTPITVGEKGSTSLWYQFTAKEDAAYTFSLEDAYENELSGKKKFYSYMRGQSVDVSAKKYERYMKSGQKLIVNLSGLDAGSSYTLKYKAVKAITEKGTYTLDFDYKDEVQELKFVVSKGGSYRILAAAFRGEFHVKGVMGKTESGEESNVMVPFDTVDGRGNETTNILKKDDIVTFTVTAKEAGKSSVSLRIAEENVAETLAVGTEYIGVSSEEKEIYYEIRIAEKALYAISAAGAPVVTYTVNNDEIVLNGNVDYRELDKDDRVMIKVGHGIEAAYTVKIAKVSAASLDSSDTAEKALQATVGEKEYVFTKEKAYVTFTAPDAGDYYIAADEIQNVTGYSNPTITPTASWTNPGIVTLTKDATVVFELGNTEATPAARVGGTSSREAMFRLTIRAVKAAGQNAMNAGETKAGTLAANETVSYQFKAAKKATYLFSFKGSGCSLSGAYDGQVIALDVDNTRTLTVKADAGAAGKYELSVTELVPEQLSLGVTASKTLKKGEKAYYEFASTVTADDGAATYQVYGSGAVSAYCDIVNASGTNIDYIDDVAGVNHEVVLRKGEKLAFTVENDGNSNQGFKLAVKEVKPTPITAAGTAVPGTLDAHENVYYEFKAAVESENGTPYQVSLDTGIDRVRIKRVQKVEFTGEGTDRKLGEPVDVNIHAIVTLEKGEKLLVKVENSSDKKENYELTVEDMTGHEVTPTAITLGVKQTGKLGTVKEKAVYEFTAEADEAYSVYFTGSNCAYSQTRISGSGADGKTTTSTITSGSWSLGSKEFVCKNGDKIEFTVSGTVKYELTVKKVTYTPLALGVQVSKTLNPGETVYYQFISHDTPVAGGETTKYQVYGYANKIESRTLSVGEDGKADAPDWAVYRFGEMYFQYLQKEKQILQFKITNNYPNTANPFKLAIKKVEYQTITLDTPVNGRFIYVDDGMQYYEFTSADTPAEGKAKTTYQVYGSARYDWEIVKADGTLVDNGCSEDGEANIFELEKDQRLRFDVYGSTDWEKETFNYSLTIVKAEEKPVTVGTEIRTGSLAEGQ